jgi:hypothetical protein
VLEVCRVGCRRDGHGVGKAFVSDNQLAFMIASQKSPQQSRNIFSFGRDRKGDVRAGSNSCSLRAISDQAVFPRALYRGDMIAQR